MVPGLFIYICVCVRERVCLLVDHVKFVQLDLAVCTISFKRETEMGETIKLCFLSENVQRFAIGIFETITINNDLFSLSITIYFLVHDIQTPKLHAR